jgi:hypothetical protein
VTQIPDKTTYIDGREGIYAVSKVITGAWNDITENWKKKSTCIYMKERRF